MRDGVREKVDDTEILPYLCSLFSPTFSATHLSPSFFAFYLLLRSTALLNGGFSDDSLVLWVIFMSL